MDASKRLGWGLLATLAACTGDPHGDDPPREPPEVALPRRIAFGSCADATLPLDTLDVATSLEPELFLWLGDNVYADTADPLVMRQKYLELASTGEFERLSSQAPMIATWDDHDYGQNDAGKDYVMKETAREIFLEFWQEPAESPRWDRDGIYTSYLFEQGGHRLQIILLDTRYNRDDLTPNDGSGKNDYIPHTDPTPTILGETQWAWLTEQLLEEADLRLIASSIQFGHSYNGYESWTLFPHERQRFVDLVQTTGAEGLVLLSGDVHWGEISRLPAPGGYDLYDVTSSGINRDWPFVESNDNRIAGPVPEFNVGLLAIDWDAASLSVTLYDVNQAPRAELSLAFEDLSF